MLDSREARDEHDLLTIRTRLGKYARGTGLVYEHLPSENDPLLWIPDIVAWCCGAGGDWLRRVQPSMGNVIDTRLPWKARSTAADRPDGHRAHFSGLRAEAGTRL